MIPEFILVSILGVSWYYWKPKDQGEEKKIEEEKKIGRGYQMSEEDREEIINSISMSEDQNIIACVFLKEPMELPSSLKITFNQKSELVWLVLAEPDSLINWIRETETNIKAVLLSKDWIDTKKV